MEINFLWCLMQVTAEKQNTKISWPQLQKKKQPQNRWFRNLFNEWLFFIILMLHWTDFPFLSPTETEWAVRRTWEKFIICEEKLCPWECITCEEKLWPWEKETVLSVKRSVTMNEGKLYNLWRELVTMRKGKVYYLLREVVTMRVFNL